MKKVLTLTALGTLFVAGYLFTNDQPTDVAMDLEPEVYSVEQPVSQF